MPVRCSFFSMSTEKSQAFRCWSMLKSLVPLDPIVGQSRRFSFKGPSKTLCHYVNLVQQNIPHWAVPVFILCLGRLKQSKVSHPWVILHGAMGCGSSATIGQAYKSDYLQYLDSAAEAEADVFLLNLPPSRWVSEIMSGVHLNCQWFFAYWSMMIWNTAPGFTPVGPGEICGSTKGRFGVGGLSLSWGESWTTPPPMVQEEVEDSVPPVQVEDTVPPVQVSSLSVSWLLKIGVVGIGKILWRCKSNETDGCLIRKTTLVLNI